MQNQEYISTKFNIQNTKYSDTKYTSKKSKTISKLQNTKYKIQILKN